MVQDLEVWVCGWQGVGTIANVYSLPNPGHPWRRRPDIPVDMDLPRLEYDGHRTLWAVSTGYSSLVYRLDIEELAGRWQQAELPWRRRRYAHVVGCWGGYIIRLGGRQVEDWETKEVLDPRTGTIITSPGRLPHWLSS